MLFLFSAGKTVIAGKIFALMSLPGAEPRGAGVKSAALGGTEKRE
jgi:hypothetical protein